MKIKNVMGCAYRGVGIELLLPTEDECGGRKNGKR